MAAASVRSLVSLLAVVLTSSPSAALVGSGCILSSTDAASLLFRPQSQGLPPDPPKGPVVGVHLSLEGVDKLRVNWMTPASPSEGPFRPVCVYGAAASNLSFFAHGFHYSYTAGMFNKTLNSAYLDVSLVPCTRTPPPQACPRSLFYRCGDPRFGWSDVFHVQVQPASVPLEPGPQIAVVGDMAMPHGQRTVDCIASRLLRHEFRPLPTASGGNYGSGRGGGGGVQLLLHAGDIAYADDFDKETRNNSWVWEAYMAGLQNVAARVPYMTAPGNHEAQYRFAAYLNWLPMPAKASNSTSPFWYSFDYLGVHVLAFSTEHDFRSNSTQHRWLAQDLKRANENRSRVPWIVVLGHRPLYCSSIVCRGRCHDEAATYRSYLEDLLYQQKVDVIITGHVHHYERSYPVYRSKPTRKDYVNPQAPVYIVNGAAGNPELNDPTYEPFVTWRAGYEVTMGTGFLLMTPSKNQLAFQYVMSDRNHTVDAFTIVRT